MERDDEALLLLTHTNGKVVEEGERRGWRKMELDFLIGELVVVVAVVEEVV